MYLILHRIHTVIWNSLIINENVLNFTQNPYINMEFIGY